MLKTIVKRPLLSFSSLFVGVLTVEPNLAVVEHHGVGFAVLYLHHLWDFASYVPRCLINGLFGLRHGLLDSPRRFPRFVPAGKTVKIVLSVGFTLLIESLIDHCFGS